MTFFNAPETHDNDITTFFNITEDCLTDESLLDFNLAGVVASGESGCLPHVQCAAKMNCNTSKSFAKKANKKWNWKKPKGMPKRPLSAYNLFFSHMRTKLKKGEILVTNEAGRNADRHSSLGFAGLAKTVAVAWKSLEAKDKVYFENEALLEQKRYKKAVEIWKSKTQCESKRRENAAKENHHRHEPIPRAQLAINGSNERGQINRTEFDITGCDNEAEFQSFCRLRSQLDTEDCSFLISALW